MLMLGVDPSPQAERVAYSVWLQWRLGSALAAEVLEFPWSAELPVPEGEFIAAPARAMIKAFAVGSWASGSPTMGKTVSTQVNQAFDQLRNYYHSAPGAAFIVVRGSRTRAGPAIRLRGLSPTPSPFWGGRSTGTLSPSSTA